MLKITTGQWDQLGEHSRSRFEQRMVTHMRVRSRHALGDEALRERTRRLIDHAQAHGITRELDVRRFLELLFDGVDDAPLQAEVTRILAAKGIDSAARISMIADAVDTAAVGAVR